MAKKPMAINKSIDVFNGDADGLCALMQWRLSHPIPVAQRISGVKRDNALLKKVNEGPGLSLLVLDINFENNRDEVQRLLAAGASIRYFDHHYPGALIEHPNLTLTINESPHYCTSLLVNDALGGQHVAWAVAGAFGDNLTVVARQLALDSGFSDTQTAQLQTLGELLNYNGYGSELADLHFDPVVLYQALARYEDPFRFVAEAAAFKQLQAGYAADMANAAAWQMHAGNARGRVYVLPDQAWARRVIGVWANALAQASPGHAHLLVCPDGRGTYTASLRAPQDHPYGAAAFCRQFAGGGGREAAAGITRLIEGGIDEVVQRFLREYPPH